MDHIFFLLDFFSHQGTEFQAVSTELGHLQNLESIGQKTAE